MCIYYICVCNVIPLAITLRFSGPVIQITLVAFNVSLLYPSCYSVLGDKADLGVNKYKVLLTLDARLHGCFQGNS